MEFRSAALFGPQALAETFLRCLRKGTATYAFNLGLDCWIKHGIYPGFVWITEKKIFQDITRFLNERLQAIPKEENTVFLVPKQFQDLTHDLESSRVRFVELEPYPDPHISAGLSMQAAAVWQTVSQGYERVDCIGFDHFFSHSGTGILRPGYVPPLHLLLQANGNSPEQDEHPEFTEVLFHHQLSSALSALDFTELPSALCDLHLVLRRRSSLARGMRGSSCYATCSGPKKSPTKGANKTEYAPLVSILMCVKDTANIVREALKSVACQTYSNIELVVVDGKSTDGTAGIVRECAAHSLRMISEEDHGYYHALNKAIGLARGDYLLVLNGDDTLLETTVEQLVQEATSNGCDIVAAHASAIDKTGSVTGSIPSFWNGSAPLRCPLRHGTMLASRAIYEDVGMYDETKKVIGDRLWMAKAFDLGATVSIIKKNLLRFRLTGVSSQGSSIHEEEIDKQIFALEPQLAEEVLPLLRRPWRTATNTLTAICRQFPLAGPLRQALVADRHRELFGSPSPEITYASLYEGNAERLDMALSSFVRHSPKNAELLVCGRPNDDELAVVAAYASEDLRIYHVPCDEKHRCRTALLRSTGDFFLWLSPATAGDGKPFSCMPAEAGYEYSLAITLRDEAGAWLRTSKGSVLCEERQLLSLLSPGDSCNGLNRILWGRHIYKRCVKHLGTAECRPPNASLALAFFIAAGFSLPPTLVHKVSPECLHRRSNVLKSACGILSSLGCPCGVCGPAAAKRICLAATRQVTDDISRNPRLGSNTRIRLVSEWNKRLLTDKATDGPAK